VAPDVTLANGGLSKLDCEPGHLLYHCSADLISFSLSGAASMWRILSSLMSDRLGITAIEYAMIGSLIAICAIAAKASIGNSLSGFFTTVATSL
jgi:Flp pilus assembly pilin Flp